MAEPAFYGKPKDIDLILELIEKYQKELREQSLSLAERIYEKKAARFYPPHEASLGYVASEPKLSKTLRSRVIYVSKSGSIEASAEIPPSLSNANGLRPTVWAVSRPRPSRREHAALSRSADGRDAAARRALLSAFETGRNADRRRPSASSLSAICIRAPCIRKAIDTSPNFASIRFRS